MKVTVVTEQTAPGTWTAVAEGHEDAPGTGTSEEAATGGPPVMTVVTSIRWAWAVAMPRG